MLEQRIQAAAIRRRHRQGRHRAVGVDDADRRVLERGRIEGGGGVRFVVLGEDDAPVAGVATADPDAYDLYLQARKARAIAGDIVCG